MPVLAGRPLCPYTAIQATGTQVLIRYVFLTHA
jgi:hypothetical protein